MCDHVLALCSMLVFKSCEGFLENTFHMLCCTESSCGIQYSKDALTHLGYHEVASTLGYLTCHDRRPRPALPVQAPPEGKKPNVTLISAVTVVVGVVLFCTVMTGLIMRCTSKKSAGSLLPLTKVCVHNSSSLLLTLAAGFVLCWVLHRLQTQ